MIRLNGLGCLWEGLEGVVHPVDHLASAPTQVEKADRSGGESHHPDPARPVIESAGADAKEHRAPQEGQDM